MNKLIAALIAAAFATVSFNAVAADAPADKPAAEVKKEKKAKHHKKSKKAAAKKEEAAKQ